VKFNALFEVYYLFDKVFFRLKGFGLIKILPLKNESIYVEL